MKLGLFAGWMVLFLLGCGVSSAQQESPGVPDSDVVTSQQTATPTIGLDLGNLLLVEQDMPQGFTLAEQWRTDNRVAAEGWSDPEKWLANYETWGRIEGFEVEFESAASGAAINMFMSVYSTDSGAQESFTPVIDERNSEIRTQLPEQGINIIALEVLEDPGLGDESVALHLRAQTIGTTNFLDSIRVKFRTANVIGSAAWISFESNVLLSDVIALAKKQLERIGRPGGGLGLLSAYRQGS